jgi:hypothetical protein
MGINCGRAMDLRRIVILPSSIINLLLIRDILDISLNMVVALRRENTFLRIQERAKILEACCRTREQGGSRISLN